MRKINVFGLKVCFTLLNQNPVWPNKHTQMVIPKTKIRSFNKIGRRKKTNIRSYSNSYFH